MLYSAQSEQQTTDFIKSAVLADFDQNKYRYESKFSQIWQTCEQFENNKKNQEEVVESISKLMSSLIEEVLERLVMVRDQSKLIDVIMETCWKALLKEDKYRRTLKVEEDLIIANMRKRYPALLKQTEEPLTTQIILGIAVGVIMLLWLTGFHFTLFDGQDGNISTLSIAHSACYDL